MIECTDCRGSGEVMTLDTGICGTEEYGTCVRCRGSGKIIEDTSMKPTSLKFVGIEPNRQKNPQNLDPQIGGRDIDQFVAKWMNARNKIEIIEQQVRKLKHPIEELDKEMREAAIGASEIVNKHGLLCVACPIAGVVAIVKDDATIELIVSTSR